MEFDEKLDLLLEKFENPRSHRENSYLCYFFEDEDEVELDFFEEIGKLMKEFHCTYEITSCGGFDSPGYDIDCYCLSYIDLKGQLQTLPIAIESL